MATQTDSSAQPRLPLNRERVLQAAIRLADEAGIESLSMRKLGQELGVEAMSLYNHVTNKEDILDGIMDVVAGEIDLSSDGCDWKSAIRQIARSAHEVLLRHPWASSLWVSINPGPARYRYMDSLLGKLREAGFSIVMTHHAFHAVANHISGHALQDANFSFPRDDVAEMGARFLMDLPSHEFLYLAEHVTYHIETGYYDEGDFEFGLDLILDSIERLREKV